MTTRPIFWTKERQKLLIKIHDTGMEHGNYQCNWVKAFEICKKEVKALGISENRIKRAWNTQSRIIAGLCMIPGCMSKAVKGSTCCPYHKEVARVNKVKRYWGLPDN